MAETSVKKYSLADIASHNTNQKAWIVIHNNIYDVTEFLNEVKMNILYYTRSMYLHMHFGLDKYGFCHELIENCDVFS